MQYEDIVYKAGILAMAVRLEEFLTREWEHRTKRKFSEKRRELSKEGKPYGEFLVEEFLDALKVPDQRIKKELKGGMNSLFRLRHEIAHPSDRVDRESDLRESDFKRTRGMCLKMDATLKGLKKARLPRMGEVMVSCSLPYDMGNAGDIIKHGVLAELAEWWDGPLRFADPFGGRPWGAAKQEVRTRLRSLSECALLRSLRQDNPPARDGNGLEKYYGSSYVVRNAAGGLAEVFASDADKLVRGDLRAAGLNLIENAIKGYDAQDGYSILDPERAERFDLILIDPFADFLRDELDVRAHGREEDRRFHKIREAINRKGNENLWVAVFVLMKKGAQVRAYEQLRDEYFAGRFVALRCLRFPKDKRRPAGESSYDMEILLISSRLEEDTPRVRKLRGRIANFRMAAEKALGRGKIHLGTAMSPLSKSPK